MKAISWCGRRPLLVGCVGTEALLRRCARRVPAHCDLLEARLDLTGLCGGEWLELCAAVQAKGLPVVLTIRDRSEGGAWRKREARRLELYRRGFDIVSAIDIEIAAPSARLLAAAAHRHRVKVISSFHDFAGTPSLNRLLAVVRRVRRLGADVVKIATMVKEPHDLARLFAVPALAKGPICVLGMGEQGDVSRIALPCAGSCLAYGAVGTATAPGQWSCSRLAKELKRWGARMD